MKYFFLLLSTLFLIACAQKPKPKQIIPDKIQKTTTKEQVTIPQEIVIPKEKAIPIVEKTDKKITCPEQKPCKKCLPKVIYKSYKKPVIGEIENAYLPEIKLTLKARVDTGATTTSVDARNIVAFERDGKKWVRFEIIGDDAKPITVKRPIEKTITIKNHQTDGQKRFVVKMRLNISNLSIYTNVSLTDRSKYNFPILIGRNFLQGNAIVDVSSRYTKKPTKVEK